MAQEDWMADFQDRRLGDMHLPGSHDAGTTKHYIDKTVAGTDSNSATQSLTILEQVQAGTRFFDLRLSTHNKKVVAHHTTAGQGAYGSEAIDDTLESVATWWKKHRTEVVIFRISHTSAGTEAHNIVRQSGIGALHKGEGNLCEKTLGEIVSEGGGLVCILDEEKFGNFINQKQGVHGYTKFEGGVFTQRGISTCGCYTRTHALHDVVCNGLRGQYDHNEKHAAQLRQHLWQVYWQKTYTNPLSTTGIEGGTTKRAVYRPSDGKVHGGTHASTSYMINLMKGMGGVGNEAYKLEGEKSHREGLLRKKVIDRDKVMYSTLAFRNYSLPNIFSYDFVNEETNKVIIGMNNKNLQAVQVNQG